MLLVPRQLRRSGMTGNVPYYGGRFTPAQAYAASHPSGRPPGSASPAGGAITRAAVPAPSPSSAAPAPSPSEAAPAPSPSAAETLAALQHLQDTGVLTPEEYAELRERVTG